MSRRGVLTGSSVLTVLGLLLTYVQYMVAEKGRTGPGTCSEVSALVSWADVPDAWHGFLMRVPSVMLCQDIDDERFYAHTFSSTVVLGLVLLMWAAVVVWLLRRKLRESQRVIT
ncbi:hypothetical protein [Brevibacterium samyangense]|uniref:hypothetical protein n=1 Tax=Brevibacterium samyangense TaxID=366888 RepID=UPI0031E12BDC